MKNLILRVSPLFVVFIFQISWVHFAHADLELFVGEQKKITLGHGQITVTNPQVIKVIPQGQSLLVVGKHTGEAEIRTSRENHSVTVVVAKRDLKTVYDQIKFFSEQDEGLKLKLAPQQVVLSGAVRTLEEWRGLNSLRERFKQKVLMQINPAQELIPQLRDKISEAIQKRSLTAINVTSDDTSVHLSLSSNQKEDKAMAETLAHQWGISVVESDKSVQLKPMVEVEILIAEVKRESFKSLGLKTPGVYSATILPAPDLSGAGVTFKPMDLDFLAQNKNDAARVIANPKILCRSGEVAHFLAGGEIPIKLMSWKNSDVIWKKYGVILDITPLADYNNGISTKIVSEISLLDEAHKVEGIPGLLTNRIETHFDLRGSKTIALSGLLRSDAGHNTTSIPLLGDIPILGELFKSKVYQEGRSELVVFVTPRVINPETVTPPSITPKFDTFSSSLWKDDGLQ